MGHDDQKSNCCMEAWLSVLTKAPLCVCVLQLIIIGALSVAGIMSSMATYGEPFKVDLDFGNYLGATTELYMFNKARDVADSIQFDSMTKEKRRLMGRSWEVTSTDDRAGRRDLATKACTTTATGCDCSTKTGGTCVQSLWHWSLNLYYRPKRRCDDDDEVCMFDPGILEEIKDFENDIQSIEIDDGSGNGSTVGFDYFCLKTKDSYAGSNPWGCRPIDTVNSVFYAVEDDAGGHIMNGNATAIRKKKGAVNDLAKLTPLHWLTDKYFSNLNKVDPKVLRSRMVGGLPLPGYKSHNDDFQVQVSVERRYLSKILNNVLLNANEKACMGIPVDDQDKHVSKQNDIACMIVKEDAGTSTSSPHKRRNQEECGKVLTCQWRDRYTYLFVNWEESTVGLSSIEVMQELSHDAMFALGSVLFVGVLVLTHTMSGLLTLVAAIGILSSFPMAFACYWWCGFRTMKLLNFVSLFLIMGIGADDVFVFFDTFHQGKAVKGEFSRISTRFKWAYKHAGGAMLVTTATTCGSFFANAVSEVAVVREFGIFMGFVVLFNYINVMTLFPAALLLNEYRLDRCYAKSDTEDSAAVVPFTPGDSGVPKSKKRRRTRLKKGQTLSVKDTGGKVEVNSLSVTEKCFHGCFTNVIWGGRYVWIFLGFAMAIMGTWAGFTFFVPLKGQPQIFLKERNQGGLDDYKYNRFVTMSEGEFHSEYIKAIKPDSDYKTAQEKGKEEDNTAWPLRAVMSCDINDGVGKNGVTGSTWDNNLGPTFVVDGNEKVQRIITVNNNLGNASGTWQASVDSSWVTVRYAAKPSGKSISSIVKMNSNAVIYLEYDVSDTNLKRGTQDKTTLKIVDTSDGSTICEQEYVAMRRWELPKMDTSNIIWKNKNNGEEKVLEKTLCDQGSDPKYCPDFNSKYTSYSIIAKKEDEAIHLEVDFSKQKLLGNAFYPERPWCQCSTDEMTMSYWKDKDHTAASVRYTMLSPRRTVNEIVLLGGGDRAEVTKVWVKLNYLVYNEYGGMMDSITHRYEYNIYRRGAEKKPEKKPTVLGLSASKQGVDVTFAPILYDDQDQDDTVSKYIFQVFNGVSTNKFVKSNDDYTCVKKKEDPWVECTVTLLAGVNGDYSVQIKGVNGKGEGPLSTKTEGAFYPLPWVVGCNSICSEKKPELSGKPTVKVNQDLSAVVSVPSSMIKVGSSTPLSSIKCVATPEGSSASASSLVVGTSSLFKSETNFNGYEVNLVDLNPVLSYTVVCELSDHAGSTSEASTKSDVFAAVNKPEGKPVLVGITVLADGIQVEFVPILSEKVTALGTTVKSSSLTVTHYVFDFSAIDVPIELSTKDDMTCQNDLIYDSLCTVKIPSSKLTKYANDMSLIVKGKNAKGESDGSEELDPGLVNEPWFVFKWLENCPKDTCHSMKPVLPKPYTQVDAQMSLGIVLSNTVVGSATPLGQVTCVTTPGNFKGTGTTKNGVIIDGPLDATKTYTASCTVMDAAGQTSDPSVSEVFAAATQPTAKPTLSSMVLTATGVVVSFEPIMLSGSSSVMDPSVTSYVLTFTGNGGSGVMSDFSGCDATGGSMVCTTSLVPSEEGSYGLSVTAQNAAGIGPASTESTSVGTAPWPLLIWKTNCPTGTCSSKQPRVTAKPDVDVVGFLTWTITIKSEIVTESGNAAVTQAINSGVGNLAAALTGAGTTAITIRSAIGQVFDTTADLVVGSTTILQANLVSAASVTSTYFDVAIYPSDLTVGSSVPYQEVTCDATLATGSSTVVATGTALYDATKKYYSLIVAPADDTPWDKSVKHVVKCKITDAGRLPSAYSSASDAIPPTIRPPTPAVLLQQKLGLTNGKYNAEIQLSGLNARSSWQFTKKSKVTCNQKGTTNFKTTSALQNRLLAADDTVTITIVDLLADVDYIFTCVAENEEKTVSEISGDISISQSSTASQVKPDKPAITSVTRESNGDVTVVVTPAGSTTTTDVTKYSCTATNTCDVGTTNAEVSLTAETHATKTLVFLSDGANSLVAGVQYSIKCKTTIVQSSDDSTAAVLLANVAVTDSLPTTTPVVTAGVSKTLSVVWVAPTDSGFECSVFSEVQRDTPLFTESPDTASTSMVFDSLVDGEEYTVVCYIQNSHKSCYGTEKKTQVYAPLATPTISTVVSDAANRKVTVTMAEPPASGRLNFLYECKSGSGSYVGGVDKVVTMTGLSSGQQIIKCRLKNDLTVSSDAEKQETIVFYPSSPQTVSVVRKTSDAAGLTVAWQAPSDNGGNALSKFKCTSYKTGEPNPQTSVETSDGTTLTLDFNSLLPGQEYDIECEATNDGTNYGKKSPKEKSPIVGAVPSTPTTTELKQVDNSRKAQLTLNIDQSSSDPAVSMYTCTATNADVADPDVIVGPKSCSGGECSTNIVEFDGLNGGKKYSVSCLTKNTVGNSANSVALEIEPVFIPAKPTIGSKPTATTDELTVTVTPPTDIGGAAKIDKYKCRAEHTVDGSLGSGASKEQESETATVKLSNLTPGNEYKVTCLVINSVGKSEWSAPSTGNWVGTVPNAPLRVNNLASPNENPKVDDVTGNIAIKLHPVESTKPEVTKYECEMVGDPSKTASADPPLNGGPVTVLFPVAKLTLGQSVKFKCLAKNPFGTGKSAYSAETDEVTPVAIPGAPTLKTGIARDTPTSISVQLTSGETGGGTISSYKCVATNSVSGQEVFKSSLSSTVLIEGLTAGDKYKIKCSNQNEKGESTFLNIPGDTNGDVYAGAKPNAPTFNNDGSNKNMPTYDAAGKITIKLNPVVSTPAVSGYLCTVNSGPDEDDSAKKTQESATHVVEFDNLQHGASTFTCIAKSPLDDSDVSAVSGSVDKAIKPVAPIVGVNSIARPGTDSLAVTVTWPTGINTGGKPITKTTCVATDKETPATTFTGESSTTTVPIVSLTAGRAYNIACTVTNSEGASPASTSVDDFWTGSLPTKPTHANVGTAKLPTYNAANPGKVTLTLSAVTAIPPVTAYTCEVVTGPQAGNVATSDSSTPVVIFEDKGDVKNGIASQPAKSTFKCQAVNKVGISVEWSDVTDEVSPKGFPGPPTNVRTALHATSKDGTKLWIRFEAPNANGGAEIEKYKCTISGTGGQTLETSTATIGYGLLFENLTPNVKIGVQCLSHTSEGWSQNTADEGVLLGTDPATPYAVPNAPKLIVAEVTADKTIKVTVTPADNEPAGVELKYKCWSILDEANDVETQFNVNEMNLEDLEAGKEHIIKCSAKNNKVVDFYSATTSMSSGILVKTLPPAPTISDVRPGDEMVTLTIDNTADTTNPNKYFTILKIQCWNAKEEKGQLNNMEEDYTTKTQTMKIKSLVNEVEAEFQCLYKTAIGGNTDASVKSTKATPGKSMESCLSVDSGNTLTIDQLRQQIADQLGVDVSQVILEEDTSCGEEGSGGGRRRRQLSNSKISVAHRARLLVDLSKYKVTIVLPDTSTATKTSKSLGTLCETSKLGDSCKSERGTINLAGFDDAKVKELQLSYFDDQKEEQIVTMSPAFDATKKGPYTVEVKSMEYYIQMILNSGSVQENSLPVKISDVIIPQDDYINKRTDEETITDDQGIKTIVEVKRWRVKTKQQIETEDEATSGDTWQEESIISVESPDGFETMEYRIVVNYKGKDCLDNDGETMLCNQGIGGHCDRLRGGCQCKDGWVSEYTGCQSYCPSTKVDGVDMKCGLNGWCNSTGKSCTCDDATYTGSGCQERVCPTCVNGAYCLKNQKKTDDDYTCSKTCHVGWGGDDCSVPTCPNSCSTHLTKDMNEKDQNFCTQTTGTCRCAAGYAGNGTSRLENDCSVKLPIRSPLETLIEVAFVWGLKNYKKVYNDKGEIEIEPEYDPKFVFNRRHLDRMLQLCHDARMNLPLLVRPDQPCWVERFLMTNWTKDAVTGAPMDGSRTTDDDLLTPRTIIDSFFKANHEKTDLETGNQGLSKKQYWNFKNDIVTAGYEYTGDVRMVQVKMRIDIPETIAARALKGNHSDWATFAKDWNKNQSKIDMDYVPMVMISSAFTRMDTELRIVRSTLDSWVLSNLICLVSVLLFTQNILISLYTMLAIFLIVASLMGK